MDTDQRAALVAAAEILETEANQLAHFMEHTMKAKLTLRTQEIVSMHEATPHRVVIAIRNEMERLRGIAGTLRKLNADRPNSEGIDD